MNYILLLYCKRGVRMADVSRVTAWQNAGGESAVSLSALMYIPDISHPPSVRPSVIDDEALLMHAAGSIGRPPTPDILGRTATAGPPPVANALRTSACSTRIYYFPVWQCIVLQRFAIRRSPAIQYKFPASLCKLRRQTDRRTN